MMNNNDEQQQQQQQEFKLKTFLKALEALFNSNNNMIMMYRPRNMRKKQSIRKGLRKLQGSKEYKFVKMNSLAGRPFAIKKDYNTIFVSPALYYLLVDDVDNRDTIINSMTVYDYDDEEDYRELEFLFDQSI